MEIEPWSPIKYPHSSLVDPIPLGEDAKISLKERGCGMASLVKRVKGWFEDSQCSGKKDIPCILYLVVCITKNDILFRGKNVHPM